MSIVINLDLDLLRTFVHIAKSGSFTRAASIVGRTQSAVSMQVNCLEAMVDGQLFKRGKGGGVSLTAHGSNLLDRAKQILALNDRVIEDLKGRRRRRVCPTNTPFRSKPSARHSPTT